MGSARRLLLVAALVLAIAADVRTDAALSTLTLAPDVDSLITTRDDSSTTSTAASTGVIGSATSDSSKKVTETPETETPATTAPSVSDTTSASDSGEEEATDAPSSASATVSPDPTSDRSTETQSEAANTSSSMASSKSATSSVDTLNNNTDTLSTGNSTNSMGTILPAVFGALACVGAIVMAVTYKKKRDANYASEETRPSSDCEYASGADFTPENRTLTTVQEDTAQKVPGLATKSSADLSAAIADFTTTNSSVSCSSPFGSTRCKARVSSPVPSCFSSNEANMEFQEPAPRHDGGSNVVLTIDNTDSSQTGPQVQL